MKIRARYVLLFVISALAGVLAAMPLHRALEFAGLPEAGISWQQARGTIWKGEIIGVRWRQAPPASIALQLQPLEGLRGHLSYQFQWQSASARGRGKVRILGRDEVLIRDSKFIVEPANLPITLQVSGFSARIGRTGCRQASGDVRVVNGPSAGADPSGRIACKADKFHVVLDGQSGQDAEVTRQIALAMSLLAPLDTTKKVVP